MNDALVGLLISVVSGALCVGIGLYMIVTGNPKLLHGYHYATTPPAELPRLARESGAGLVVAGVGCALIGVPGPFAVEALVAGVVLLVVGIAVIFIAIIRHNGSLISFAPPAVSLDPVASARKRRRAVLLGALLGVLLGLFGFVPGVYMIATGDVSMLHSYHYAGVAPQDIPHLALAEGLAFIGLGLGIALCGVAGGAMTSRPSPRWAGVLMVLGCVTWGAGLIAMLAAIPYFGGSLAP